MGGVQKQRHVFNLLLYKNFLVRKKHWIKFLFYLILVPVGFSLIFVFLKNKDVYYSSNDTFYNYTAFRSTPNNYNYYFASDNEFLISMDYVKRCLGTNRTREFDSTAAAFEAYVNRNLSDVDDVMVFFKNDSSSEHLKYTIRMKNPGLSELYKENDYGPESASYDKPFIRLQFCLDLAFISEKPGTSFSESEIFLQQMPSPESTTSKSYRLIYVLPFMLMLAFFLAITYEVDMVTDERTIGVNVLMAMNGVSTCKNLLSWFVSGVLLSPIYTFFISIQLTKVPFEPRVVDPYFPKIDVFLIWLVLYVHNIHLLCFGMHIASYLSRPMYVKIVTAILTVTSLFVLENLPWTVPYIGIVLPHVLLDTAIDELIRSKEQMGEKSWNDIFKVQNPTISYDKSIGIMLILSLLGSILHFVMAVYIQEIKPGKYGVAKRPFYFMKGSRKTNDSTEKITQKIDYSGMNGKPFEPAPETFIPGIRIRNLEKSYFNKIHSKVSVQALKGVSVDFYENHITSLLGHNGAGKTTMMSILTGMTSPSDGTVLVNGKYISEDLDDILNDIGLCPQENMLFPDLSVFEHLLFFGMLKRSNETKTTISENAEALLQKLNFSEKRNILPAELSGGQKRRLCLSMALIGDSKILILDEPTSGMDPESRRDVWDIILGLRAQKTILISTHDMEEANVLGDRIAILHSGTLRCDGSPMFLKKLYGQGNMEVILSTEPYCNPKMVLDTLNPNGRINNTNGARLELSIPSSRNLPDALDAVEARKQELGVTGMSVSLITLEQIFLTITTECNDSPVASTAPLTYSSRKVTGLTLTMQRMFALLAKKFTYTIKNPGVLLISIMIPLIGLFLTSDKFKHSDSDSTETQICLSMYTNPQTLSVSMENDTYSTIYDEFAEEQGSKQIISSTNTSIIHQLMNIGKENRDQYLYNVIAAAEFNGIERMTAMIPDKATFGLPISINLLTNTILKNCTDDSHQIDVYFQALPEISPIKTLENDERKQFFRNLLHDTIRCSFVFLMTTFFVINVKREAATGIKQLQLMTGVSPIFYWGIMFVFDYLVLCVVVVVLVSGMIIFGMISGFVQALIHTLLLLLFSANVLPMLYVWSFSKLPISTVMTIMGVLPVAMILCEIFISELYQYYKVPQFVFDAVKVILHVIPYSNYINAVHSFRKLRSTFELEDKKASADPENNVPKCSHGMCQVQSYFETRTEVFNIMSHTMTESAIYFCGTFIFFVALLMIFEYRVISKLLAEMKKCKDESTCTRSDDQVLTEKNKVAAEITQIHRPGSKTPLYKQTEDGEICDDKYHRNLFLAYDLSKCYKNVSAVRKVNFRVKQRECFGLLGINGAGKSTTFRMLTGEEIPNTGSMYLNNNNLKSNRSAYLSEMGYCPQHSAIIESLNAIDHLRLFARLRGIPRSRVDGEVDYWINKINLKACAARPAGTYSEGNKRRLNIAIAMIGNPILVLLDEPTAGVDPGARRLLWNVIASCQTNGQSVILTSHSMEECEALCGRIVIMAKGELLCIGPSQQLKQRFEAGFDIIIKIHQDQNEPLNIVDLKSNMTIALPCEITDENSSHLVYHVHGQLTWRAMYDAMNYIKEHHSCVEDFSIISATLEQLFLKFAKTAKIETSGRQPMNI